MKFKISTLQLGLLKKKSRLKYFRKEGDNMVKAKDIININKEHERYKKLSENETDIVKRMKYGRIFRDYEYKVLQIELQLNNI